MLLKTIYSSFMTLLLPFALLRLAIRARHNKGYLQNWSHRLGLAKVSTEKPVIWVHAVSLGETVAISPVIQGLINAHPNYQVLVTNMTLTGLEKTRSLFGDQVVSQYIPYDAPWIMRPFVRKLAPSLVVISETELWPNMLQQCHKMKVPVVLANARMNPRSASRYLKAGQMARDMFSAVSSYAIQTESDLAQFSELNIDQNKLELAGNLKFEQAIPAHKTAQGKEWQVAFKRPVWVAASTHDGEEQIILAAHQELLIQIPNLLLILVPRHPERFNAVADNLQRQQLAFCRHSLEQLPSSQHQVWLGDTMGNLFAYYACSNLAFVGGSLVDVGGHSPVEPAAIGVPVVMGPFVHKCQQGHDELLNHQALISVTDNSLKHIALNILGDEKKQQQMHDAALAWVNSNLGATERHMKIISKYLD